MRKRPDCSQHRQDPRFDRYRNRVGRLVRGTEEVGFVLVTVEPYAEELGSRWWSRWGPTVDVLQLWTVVDGEYSDSLSSDDAAEEELVSYDAGRHEYCGDELAVRWADGEESRQLSRAHFGQ